jgi:transposase-like protein
MSHLHSMGEDLVRRGERTKPEFRQQAVERMQVARNLGLLAQELGISVRTLYRWKDVQLGRVKKVREPVPREKRLEAEIQRLKQALADRALEIDFFKGVGEGLRPAKSHENRFEFRIAAARSGEIEQGVEK